MTSLFPFRFTSVLNADVPSVPIALFCPFIFFNTFFEESPSVESRVKRVKAALRHVDFSRVWRNHHPKASLRERWEMAQHREPLR